MTPTPKRQRYFVQYDNDTDNIIIEDKTKSKTQYYDVREFIYGQSYYNEQTSKYPLYVHGIVWDNIKLYRGG